MVRFGTGKANELDQLESYRPPWADRIQKKLETSTMGLYRV